MHPRKHPILRLPFLNWTLGFVCLLFAAGYVLLFVVKGVPPTLGKGICKVSVREKGGEIREAQIESPGPCSAEVDKFIADAWPHTHIQIVSYAPQVEIVGPDAEVVFLPNRAVIMGRHTRWKCREVRLETLPPDVRAEARQVVACLTTR